MTAIDYAEPVEQQSAIATQSADDFSVLLMKEFNPRTEQTQEAIGVAVKTLALQALENAVVMSNDAYQTIQTVIAEIDRKLSLQINTILHHDSFQKLESSWRGLHYLVNNSETDEHLKIRFMPLTKTEMSRMLKRYKGVAWDQSPLFKKVYEEEYGQFGGEPLGCLIGDYYFDHSPQDVETLGELSKIAAAAHCPFVTGASPAVMQMESWQELSNPRDLTKIFENSEYAAWRHLRESDDSRYLGLAMPRFHARLPYSARSNPVDAFNFEEDTNGADHKRYAWINSAYAMAANINRSFKEYGWCTSIRGVESGGAVLDLPTHTFPTDDGGVDMKCPTEIAISDRREAELAKNGFMPFVHRKNSNCAAFIGAAFARSPDKSPFASLVRHQRKCGTGSYAGARIDVAGSGLAHGHHQS